MILSYQGYINKYGSDYKLKKELYDGKLFMEEKGLYSTKRNTAELDLIMKKYPKAVCTIWPIRLASYHFKLLSPHSFNSSRIGSIL